MLRLRCGGIFFKRGPGRADVLSSHVLMHCDRRVIESAERNGERESNGEKFVKLCLPTAAV